MDAGYSSFFRDASGKFSTTRLTQMVLLALIVFLVVYNQLVPVSVEIGNGGSYARVVTFPEALIAEIFVFIASLYGVNLYFTRGRDG